VRYFSSALAINLTEVSFLIKPFSTHPPQAGAKGCFSIPLRESCQAAHGPISAVGDFRAQRPLCAKRPLGTRPGISGGARRRSGRFAKIQERRLQPEQGERVRASKFRKLAV